MRIVTAARERTVKLRLGLDTLSQLPLRPLVKHCDDRADDFEVTELFRRDVKQHVASTRVVLAYRLCEISARCRKFALRSPELLQKQIGETRIRRRYAHGVLQSLVVHKHGISPNIEVDYAAVPPDG